jgi:hypothetical protein
VYFVTRVSEQSRGCLSKAAGKKSIHAAPCKLHRRPSKPSQVPPQAGRHIRTSNLKTPFRAVGKDKVASDRRKVSHRLSDRVVPMGIRWPPQNDQSEAGNQRIQVGRPPSIRVCSSVATTCPHIGGSALAVFAHKACPHIGRSALAVFAQGPTPFPTNAANTLRSKGDDVIHRLTLQPRPVGTTLAHTW